MENDHTHAPIIVLKLEFRHEECSEILEKQLLRIDGVHQVAINREKKEVTIKGDIDPLMLVKHIAKLGKRAELLLYDKKPKTDQANPAEKRHRDGQSCGEKHPNGAHQHPAEASKEKYFGCPGDDPHCGMNNSFHYEKYRQKAKDFEEETFQKQSGQFRSVYKDDNYRAAASKEFEEGLCRDQHGQCHNENYRAAPRNKAEEEQLDPYGRFRSVHNGKYRPAAGGVEEETCWGQHGHFHRGSRDTAGFLPPMNNEGEKYQSFPHHHPHRGKQDFIYHNKEEMNHGHHGQFFGRSRSTSGFVPPRNTEDANYCSFSDDHPHRAAAKGVEEERNRAGYDQFQGRGRNANYGNVPPRYNEDMFRNAKDHYQHMMGDDSREDNIQEVIEQARKDMDQFFSMRRRSTDHFAGGGPGYHHETPNPSRWTGQEPLSDDYYGDRNRPPPAFRGRPVSEFGFREEPQPPPFEQHHQGMPPPPPPPYVHRGRPGTRYDSLFNLFSDENPSSCTII